MSFRLHHGEFIEVPIGADVIHEEVASEREPNTDRDANAGNGGPQVPSANAISSQTKASSDEEKELIAPPGTTKRKLKSAFGIGTTPRDTTWKTTWKRYGPLTGIFCLFLAFSSIFASFAILYESNGRPTADWTYTPATYLAIFTAVANQAIGYAGLQGVVITWWSRALTRSTLARLHRDWDTGTSIWKALAAGRHTSILSIVCIISTFVAIDGPLLQRSSSVRSVTIQGDLVPLNFTIAPEIPRGSTGGWNGGGLQESPFPLYYPLVNGETTNAHNYGTNSHFDKVRLDFLHNASMTTKVEGCRNKCSAKVRAPALVRTSCSSKVMSVDYNKEWYPTPRTQYTPLDRFGFLTLQFLDVDGDQEGIRVFTAYSSIDKCVGSLNVTVCNLGSAVGEYDVTVSGSDIALDWPPNPRIIAVANNSAVNHENDDPDGGTPGHSSTLAGILYTMFDYPAYAFWVTYPNSMPSIELTSGEDFEHEVLKGDPYCPSFTDPTDELIQAFQSVMFRAGVHFGNTWNETDLKATMDAGLEAAQSVMGNEIGSHNVFHTDYTFFFGALAVELFSIAVISATYWGWWRLGRAVSFSPLEIAKAFEAPLLAGYNSNSSGRELAKRAGEVEVRYGATGEVNRNDGGEFEARKIAFADPSTVYLPLDRYRFES